MAITLITGVPGTGKTALTVRKLLEAGVKESGRLIYSHGVKNLTVPHVEFADPKRWHLDIPDGAIIVIDEVQDHWPAGGTTAKAPDYIMELAKHRHRGFDFILTTQDPKYLHTVVLGLVNPHIHLRNLGFLGRRYYEWPECSRTLAWKTAPISGKYKLPRKVFDLYTSATQHNKPSNRIPKSVVIVAGCAVAVVGLGWHIAGRIWQETGGGAAKPKAPAPSASAPAAGTGLFGGRPPAMSAPSWPVYTSTRVVPNREPYDLRGLQLEGEYTIGKVRHASFGVVISGQRVTTVTLAQLLQAGYVWTAYAPCAGVLRFGDTERMVSCAQRATAPSGPSPAASAPINAPA